MVHAGSERTSSDSECHFNFVLKKHNTLGEVEVESQPERSPREEEDKEEDKKREREENNEMEEEKANTQSRSSSLPLAQILNLVSEPSKRKNGR